MGQVGDLPRFYLIAKAAEKLGMSFVELAEHENCDALIRIADVVTKGDTDGEYNLRTNPAFKREVARRQKAING